jgi:hypothetical protein
MYRKILITVFCHNSGEVIRITPADSTFSWNLLALDGNNVLASKN